MLPTFIVIGAAKSATTSIAHHLSRHPGIFFSDPKEVNFFCYDKNYSRGIEYYESFFSDASESQQVGEGSVLYTLGEKHPQTFERMAKHLRTIKLVYVVRHPLVRVSSHWLQWLANGWTTPRPLQQGLQKFPELLDASYYWKQIEPYIQHYGPKNVGIWTYEDYSSNEANILSEICEFIGADPGWFQENESLRAVNRTVDHFQSNWLGWKLHTRYYKQMDFFRRLLPRGLRKYARRLAQKPIEKKHGVWTEHEWNRVVKLIQPDAEAILSHIGKTADFWDWQYSSYLASTKIQTAADSEAA